MMFAQTSDLVSTLITFVFFFGLIFLYPRLMLSQIINKLEQSAAKMEGMSREVNSMISKRVASKPSSGIKSQIDDFTDFFVVEPSAIDPYGLVRKVDQMIRSMEDRFGEFSGEIGSKLSAKERQQVNYALRAAIGMRQLSKMVRHFVELAKKFKNFQIAMIMQMQLPLIENIAEGEAKGAKAFLNSWPVGDSIGPLVAASLIDSSRPVAEDVVMGEAKIRGRHCFVLKATGPEPHLGRVDEALEKIMKKHRIGRVVTIDAAQKLEGEKTGSVAEGVGFAMGGIGQREIIENVLLPKKIPIDSIVVKVGITEAITPMRKAVYDSVPDVISRIEHSAGRVSKGGKLVVIGVGNSSGIGNSKKELGELKALVNGFEKEAKREEELRKKGKLR